MGIWKIINKKKDVTYSCIALDEKGWRNHDADYEYFENQNIHNTMSAMMCTHHMNDIRNCQIEELPDAHQQTVLDITVEEAQDLIDTINKLIIEIRNKKEQS